MIFILKLTTFGKHCWKLDELGIKLTAVQTGVDQYSVASRKGMALGQAIAPSRPAGQGAVPVGC